MSNKQSRKYLKPILVTFLLIFVTWGFSIFYKNTTCQLRWRGTGYEAKYVMFSGCLLQQTSGKWMPENRIRGVD